MGTSELSLRTASKSIQGRRDYNEDAVLVSELPDGRTLVAVADGMGGHAAGEVASAMALEVLEEQVTAGASLEEASFEANRQVHAKASSDLSKKGMGTTLVVMLSDGEQFELSNVGDSRGYLITDAGIRQLTEDHSFVAEAVRAGQSEAEARESRWKDALTRSIGTSVEVRVDTFGPFPLEEPTMVLLCSDGLFKTLDDGELEAGLLGVEDLQQGVDAVVDAAYESGSDDNISIAVAEFGRLTRGSGRERVAERSSAATMVMEPLGSDEEEGASDPPDSHGASAAERSAGRPAGGPAAEGGEEPSSGDAVESPGSGGIPPTVWIGVAAVMIVVFLALLLRG